MPWLTCLAPVFPAASLEALPPNLRSFSHLAKGLDGRGVRTARKHCANTRSGGTRPFGEARRSGYSPAEPYPAGNAGCSPSKRWSPVNCSGETQKSGFVPSPSPVLNRLCPVLFRPRQKKNFGARLSVSLRNCRHLTGFLRNRRHTHDGGQIQDRRNEVAVARNSPLRSSFRNFPFRLLLSPAFAGQASSTFQPAPGRGISTDFGNGFPKV